MNIQMQAADFFNAYLALRGNSEILADQSSNSQRKKQIRYTGSVDIVCLAFSVELYLKDLHSLVSEKVPKGHSIIKLYRKLPEDIQKEIFEHNSISQNPFITRGNFFLPESYDKEFTAYDGFIHYLEGISDGFEKWRYSYESSCLKYESFFAEALIEAIQSVSLRLRTQTKL